jgi:hypothetical protein
MVTCFRSHEFWEWSHSNFIRTALIVSCLGLESAEDSREAMNAIISAVPEYVAKFMETCEPMRII